MESTIDTPTQTPHNHLTHNRRRARPRVNVVEGMKWCPKCESRLNVTAFGIDTTREDGLSGWCRSCRAERTRLRRVENPEAAREDVNSRYRTNPDRWRAAVAVARAVESGDLTRPEPGTPCKCGKVSPLEAHHHLGHDKEHHLDVVWCCRSCRTRADAAQRPRTRRVLTHSMLVAV